MDVLCTPKRTKRAQPLDRKGAAHRRKSLFGISGVSPLSSPEANRSPQTAQLSPSWSSDSPIKSPCKTPSKGSVKALQNDFTQMALTRTPENRVAIITRSSPRVLGVRQLSPDRGLITPNKFYGKANIVASKSDSKTFYQKIRDCVRVRLPMETLPREKKRGRSSTGGSSMSKRHKGMPRYRLFEEDLKLEKKVKNYKTPSEIKLNERRVEKKDKPTYNWQFFNSKTPPTTKVSKLFSNRSPSVLTPPPTAKKRRLISSYDMDHLTLNNKTSTKENIEFNDENNEDEHDIVKKIRSDFSDYEDEVDSEVNQLLENLTKDGVLGNDEDEATDTVQPCNVSNEKPDEAADKLFPIFSMNGSNSAGVNSSNRSPMKGIKMKRPKPDSNQLILDVGQKNLREVECTSCGLLYVNGDDIDEEFHAKHHSTCKAFTFTNYKASRCVGVYGFDMVFLIKSGDSKACWDQAKKVLEIVDNELGFPEGWNWPSQVYLYVRKKRVIGCVAARSQTIAHRLLPNYGIDAEFCTEEEFPVRVGISRIWVHGDHRRQGIASKLVDTVRRNYAFGEILKLEDLAFSSPTEDGKQFAKMYCKRDDFLVYTH